MLEKIESLLKEMKGREEAASKALALATTDAAVSYNQGRLGELLLFVEELSDLHKEASEQVATVVKPEPDEPTI